MLLSKLYRFQQPKHKHCKTTENSVVLLVQSSLTEKPINRDNVVVDGTQSEDHSLQIIMKNLRLRDDYSNHNKDQMDDINVSQNLKQEARSNNGDVLPQNKLR